MKSTRIFFQKGNYLTYYSTTVEPFTNGHLSITATFLADSPYIDSRLKLSTMATFFCPQGGLCEKV